MTRYRKIDVKVWGDERFRRLSSPQPNGQTLWFWLLTNKRTGAIPGLYEVGEAEIAESLGWPLKGFREGFGELFREGLVKADWNARVVWIPNVMKYDPPANPNVVRSWRSAWDEVPDCNLKHEAYSVLKPFVERLGEGFAKAFGELRGHGLAKPEPEQ